MKSNIQKEKVTLNSVLAYIVGNLRSKLYYSRFYWLIREHIRDQIEFRINFMDKQCLNEGACKMCGCTTTALQMANKRCSAPCYPAMMNKKEWMKFIKTSIHCEGDYTWNLVDGELYKYYIKIQPKHVAIN